MPASLPCTRLKDEVWLALNRLQALLEWEVGIELDAETVTLAEQRQLLEVRWGEVRVTAGRVGEINRATPPVNAYNNPIAF